MAHITVLGGTGYAGSSIVAAGAQRGHAVVSYSRRIPETQIEGVEYHTGDVSDDTVLATAMEGADVVISALSPPRRARGRLQTPRDRE